MNFSYFNALSSYINIASLQAPWSRYATVGSRRDTTSNNEQNDKFAQVEKAARDIGAAGEYESSRASDGMVSSVVQPTGRSDDNYNNDDFLPILAKKSGSWGYSRNAKTVSIDVNMHGDLAVRRFADEQYPIGSMVDILF